MVARAAKKSVDVVEDAALLVRGAKGARGFVGFEKPEAEVAVFFEIVWMVKGFGTRTEGEEVQPVVKRRALRRELRGSYQLPTIAKRVLVLIELMHIDEPMGYVHQLVCREMIN